MSHSESNDGNDIFWPGYVDAVTNLAINLLFVIAVMSIVVLSATMQMAKMSNKDTNDRRSDGPQQEMTSTAQEKNKLRENLPPKVETEKNTIEKVAAKKSEAHDALDSKSKVATEQLDSVTKAALAKAIADKTAAEKLVAEKTDALTKLERELKTVTEKLAAAEKVATAKTIVDKAAEDTSAGVSASLARVETVNANQKRVPSHNPNQLHPISGGVVVAFGTDVIDLTEVDAAELVKKMATFGALKSSNWKIQVISPMGFSEAVRLAYYRVNAVRNVLLKQGIPSAAIDMQVTESEQAGANNARVLVRLAK